MLYDYCDPYDVIRWIPEDEYEGMFNELASEGYTIDEINEYLRRYALDTYGNNKKNLKDANIYT